MSWNIDGFTVLEDKGLFWCGHGTTLMRVFSTLVEAIRWANEMAGYRIPAEEEK